MRVRIFLVTHKYLLHTFVRYQPTSHTLYFTLHCACVLNNVVLTTVIEIVEILDGRVGKRSVERVRYVITLGHCEIWSHFTHSLYFHSPLARENTDPTHEISRHISR